MKSTLAITDTMNIPNPLTQGTAVSVKGKITSNSQITNVTAEIKCGSSIEYSATVKPNAKTYYMKNMEEKLCQKLWVGLILP